MIQNIEKIEDSLLLDITKMKTILLPTTDRIKIKQEAIAIKIEKMKQTKTMNNFLYS